jgi:lipopolysaccharide transport system ATP-binding protein
MKARLAFSVAISVKPDLMLIDEVLGVGDASFQKKSGDALRSKLTSEQAVVLVSHNKEVIKSLCNRAVWIDGGVIRVSGEPKHVIAQYELLQN